MSIYATGKPFDFLTNQDEYYALEKPEVSTHRAPWPRSRRINPNASIQYSRVILGAVWPPIHHLAALDSEDLFLGDCLASVSIPSHPESIEFTRKSSDACNSTVVRAASSSNCSSNIDEDLTPAHWSRSEYSIRPASVELGVDWKEKEEKPVHLLFSSCDKTIDRLGSAPVDH